MMHIAGLKRPTITNQPMIRDVNIEAKVLICGGLRHILSDHTADGWSAGRQRLTMEQEDATAAGRCDAATQCEPEAAPQTEDEGVNTVVSNGR